MALDETQRYLVENWPQLPPNVQAAILNVIDWDFVSARYEELAK